MAELWFKGTKGLNNKLDPVRLEYNKEDGIQWLAECWNIDIDASGRISRRRGWSTTDVTVPCHSIFTHAGTCLFVSEGYLRLLGTDYSYGNLVAVTADARMTYCPVGNKIYYMNGVDKGYVQGGVNYTWDIPSTVYGPETTRAYQPPPSGQIIGHFRGRMYIVSGNVIWYTEAYGPNLADMARNFLQFESAIQIFHPVKEGIYVGTSDGVWFLRGTGPSDFVWDKAYLVPAIRGTDVDVNCDLVGDGQIRGVGVMWTGANGICLGLPTGEVVNFTNKVIDFEVGTMGGAVIMGSRYVCTMLNTSQGPLTLSLNLERLALTQYLNYWFRSYTKFGESYLGVNDSGVFVLDEDDMDGTDIIESGFKVPLTDFGLKGDKHIRFMELSLETDAGVLITPYADEMVGKAVELVPVNRANRQEVQKVPIGRYLNGRYWSFRVANLDGADFSVDQVFAELAGYAPA